MEFTRFKIDGLILVTPKVFGDDRGFFLETYNKKEFTQGGIIVDFVQTNHSRSQIGVLRGLHFQTGTSAQDKLVWVTRGKVFDVAVDLRPKSETFGCWQGLELSEENKQLFFIPKGFAHGFLVLSDWADFQYQVSNFYQPESEKGVIWNDPDIGVAWPNVNDLIISEKDQNWPHFAEVKKSLIW
ncbi:MAG: dTDP-4-dehydrorhamnose 3,5-epimerase [Candidatus Shapirobacteria bacterium]|nr:dTDP-4-dehydrorhamnose 3,5-epimerase [Candidatus Shapirobacteria bacterium]